MRKAKFAALIIGGVSTCIFGGLFGVCATAPVVSSVAPSNDVKNIYEVNSEEMSNVAAVTSIRTTAITTTSNVTTTTTTTATTSAVGAVTTTTENNILYMDASLSFSGAVPAQIASAAPEVCTEAPTESYTDAPVYTEPVYEKPVYEEPVYEEPVYEEPVYEEPVYEEPVYEEPTAENTVPPVEEVTEPPTQAVEASGSDVPEQSALPITDEEYIILCNAVAHEAGCNWINEYDKAKVVEVIMNRVYSPLYPNSILEVLTQPFQFSGSSAYVYLGDFSGYVTQSVKDAVSLYFNEPESFTEGYFGFYGDGYRNYFY